LAEGALVAPQNDAIGTWTNPTYLDGTATPGLSRGRRLIRLNFDPSLRTTLSSLDIRIERGRVPHVAGGMSEWMTA
ncbi:MAG: hypothetical protein AAGH38_03600, partial [Pseudomonadota bacterium]